MKFISVRHFRIVCFLFLIISYSAPVAGQDQPDKFNSFNIQSPTAFSFNRINNVPMSLFTGQIQISIPLYAAKIGSIDFSMNATYLGGNGVQADAASTVLGKAWMLNVGGIITRHKRGVPDDYVNETAGTGGVVPHQFDGILYVPSVDFRNDGEYRVDLNSPIYDCDLGVADSQHDIFEFNVMGKSGKFYIGKNWEILMVPDSKLKIIPETTGSIFKGGHKVATRITGFTIIDEAGFKYIFRDVEVKREDVNYFYIGQQDVNSFMNKPYVSSWMLSRVESPFNNDFITFNYGEVELHPASEFMPFNPYSQAYSKVSTLSYGTYGSRGMYDFYTTEAYINSIQFSNNTSIKLRYFNEADVLPIRREPMLRKIEILNGDQAIVKSISLSYYGVSAAPGLGYGLLNRIGQDLTKEVPSAGFLRRHTLFLESIKEQTSDGTFGAPHIFDYYLDKTALDQYSGIDHWGYFNGKGTYDHNLIPLYSGPAYDISDRSPDIVYARAGAMKKIQYPTGGTEEFDYELNMIKTPTGSEYIGGLRIKSRVLRNRLNPSADITKFYRYVNEDGTSSGFLGDKPLYAHEKPVYWDNGGWPSNPTLKRTVTTHVSHSLNNLSYVEGSPVGYSRVEEIEGSLTAPNGKVVHEFSDLNYASLWIQPDVFPYRPVDRPTWALGLPLKEKFYDKNNRLVKEVISTYDIRQAKKNVANYRSMYVTMKGEVDVTNGGNLLRYIYSCKNFYPVVGRAFPLTKTERILTDNNLTLITQTRYNFDENTLAIRRLEESSGGGEKVVLFNYPYDYNLGPSSGITQLNTLGITAPVIESETWVKAYGFPEFKLQKSQATDYAVYNGSQVMPSAVYEYEAVVPKSVVHVLPHTGTIRTQLLPDNNYKKVFDYPVYSAKAKLTETLRKDVWRENILIDNEDNVTAIAHNASSSSVAYTSFENSFAGNWTFTGDAVADATAPTGSKVFNLTAAGINGIRKTGLTAAREYTLSYWTKAGSPLTVSGTVGTAVAGRSVGSWKRYIHTLKNITEVIISGSAVIDELSLYPKEASMSTRTYRQLVGMTSATDENGRITSYSYDDFGRLKNILDENRNIVKQLEYSFAPPEYNPTPIWVQTPNTRCAPCPQNGAYLSGIMEREEKDLNPHSPTYNTFRWVNYYTCDNAAWTATGNTRCLKDINNQNTGEHEKEERDLNPCSATYNSTRWVAGGTVEGICPDTRTIYATVCKENETTDGSGKTYADVVIRFYTHASMNNPIAVSGLTINLLESNGSGSHVSTPVNTIGSNFITVYSQIVVQDNAQPTLFRTYVIAPGTGYTPLFSPCD